MNAKFCKKLRRLAEEKSVGERKRRITFPRGPFMPALNDPNTTRGVYRDLKRIARQTRRP